MKAMKRFTKLLAIIILTTIFSIGIIESVNADAGPKPSLTITVKGMDAEKYWLDLLVKDDANYSWLRLGEQERKQVSRLAEYIDLDGFHPALLGGTYTPLIGKLEGEKQPDGTMVHRFGYMGVPKTFKIAILTEDGRLIISDVIQRKQFASDIEYDLRGQGIAERINISVGTVSEGMSWSDFAFNLILTIMLTLVIEIFIARLFGFTIIKYFKLLIYTNILTQIILNFIVFFFISTLGILYGIIFGLVLGEVIVFTIEANLYVKLLEEKSKGKRLLYAFTANLLSVIGGFFIFI